MTFTRAQCIRGTRCVPMTHAESIDCLAHHSRRTLAEIATSIGRDPNYLRKATSPNDDTHPYRSDLRVPMTLSSGAFPLERNYAAIEFEARSVGGVFLLLPTVEGDDQDEILNAHLDAVKEHADIAGKLQAILPNGITADEANGFDVEIDEAIARLVALKTIVRAHAEKGSR